MRRWNLVFEMLICIIPWFVEYYHNRKIRKLEYTFLVKSQYYTPVLNEFIDPKERLKKLSLRFFKCHLENNFLTFWANSVKNPQRKQ